MNHPQGTRVAKKSGSEDSHGRPSGCLRDLVVKKELYGA
jgi:hypothetical protein